jgi:muconolactone delta-isomerase
MKVFAVGNVPNVPAPEQRDALLSKEVPHTLRLYLDGLIEQFWFRTDRPGVFFLLNVESLDQAKATLQDMPLAKAGIMVFEVTPVGPLAPLARLLPAE